VVESHRSSIVALAFVFSSSATGPCTPPSWDEGDSFAVLACTNGFLECHDGVLHHRLDDSGHVCLACGVQWQSRGLRAGFVMKLSSSLAAHQPRAALPLARAARAIDAMPARKSSSSGPKDPGKGSTTPRKEAKGKSTAKASAIPPPTTAAQLQQIHPKAAPPPMPVAPCVVKRQRTKSPPED
jgi:hypothetical protein